MDENGECQRQGSARIAVRLDEIDNSGDCQEEEEKDDEEMKRRFSVN